MACQICDLDHERKEAIEAAIRGKVPVRTIQSEYKIGKNIVQRHRTECMVVAELVAANPERPATGAVLEKHAQDGTDAQAVIGELLALKGMVSVYLNAATARGKSLPLPLVRELRMCLELLGKMTIATQGGAPSDPLSSNPMYRLLTELSAEAVETGTPRGTYQGDDLDTGKLVGSLDPAEDSPVETEPISDVPIYQKASADAPTAHHAREKADPLAPRLPRSPLTPLEAHKAAMAEMQRESDERDRYDDL